MYDRSVQAVITKEKVILMAHKIMIWYMRSGCASIALCSHPRIDEK